MRQQIQSLIVNMPYLREVMVKAGMVYRSDKNKVVTKRQDNDTKIRRLLAVIVGDDGHLKRQNVEPLLVQLFEAALQRINEYPVPVEHKNCKDMWRNMGLITTWIFELQYEVPWAMGCNNDGTKIIERLHPRVFTDFFLSLRRARDDWLNLPEDSQIKRQQIKQCGDLCKAIDAFTDAVYPTWSKATLTLLDVMFPVDGAEGSGEIHADMTSEEKKLLERDALVISTKMTAECRNIARELYKLYCKESNQTRMKELETVILEYIKITGDVYQERIESLDDAMKQLGITDDDSDGDMAMDIDENVKVGTKKSQGEDEDSKMDID